MEMDIKCPSRVQKMFKNTTYIGRTGRSLNLKLSKFGWKVNSHGERDACLVTLGACRGKRGRARSKALLSVSRGCGRNLKLRTKHLAAISVAQSGKCLDEGL